MAVSSIAWEIIWSMPRTAFILNPSAPCRRNYSSEDNVIRELCKDGGRNRYCGAGTSMLIYPFDDVRNMSR